MIDRENMAERLYMAYRAAVNGKRPSGKLMDDWKVYSSDPSKNERVDAWRKTVDEIATFLEERNKLAEEEKARHTYSYQYAALVLAVIMLAIPAITAALTGCSWYRWWTVVLSQASGLTTAWICRNLGESAIESSHKAFKDRKRTEHELLNPVEGLDK
jgi:hypothetical protein